MADYIYTMEIRLTPDQLKGVSLIQEVARAAGMNLYLTGGAIRDIISGFTIRDLDFTVQGNPLKLQKELEKAGAHVAALEDESRTIFLSLPGNARAEISMARTERFEKTGKAPIVSPATIHEDLRRGPQALAAVEIVPGDSGYDYSARYTAGKTEFYVPARLPADVAAEVARIAVTAHSVLGLRDLSRTDLIVDEEGVPYFLEVNVSPGMTETSTLPLALEASGHSFGSTCVRLLELAAERGG